MASINVCDINSVRYYSHEKALEKEITEINNSIIERVKNGKYFTIYSTNYLNDWQITYLYKYYTKLKYKVDINSFRNTITVSWYEDNNCTCLIL